ncbi:MAG: 7-carboxy-7-deazaguanine synthase QueE, partial [Gammaproteobacteria bacterium]
MGRDSLKISELFFSLQGESSTSGLPTVFVRLTGCPLRCHYCDSEYAFYGGQWRSFADIEAEIAAYGARYVCVTGGEPLAQRACLPFLTRLCDAGYCVSLETAGALDIAAVDARVIKVMDLKTPASGEAQRNRYENIEHLQAQDQIKFVLCDRADYDWARQRITELDLLDKCEVLFSASYGELAAKELA